MKYRSAAGIFMVLLAGACEPRHPDVREPEKFQIHPLQEKPMTPTPRAVRKPIPAPDDLKKLPPDGGPEFNRLVFEKSPYLLQHASNPVDWYPWGPEAFERAKKEDKPIFLSIGYSTCHWCHVMEHESFENPAVGAMMNEHFVAIKVDREERPDVDNVYMTVCQALTGHGGWPLTILMTPEKKPFFAGTYFPRETTMGHLGLMELLKATAQLWKTERRKAEEAGTEIVEKILNAAPDKPAGAKLAAETLNQGYEQFKMTFDETHGGFGKRGPKFPSPHNLSFLFRMWKRTGDKQALAMAERTLQAMRRGGMYDHIGFGFHRYSTDREFLVPHFEKMLYDQAMLALASLEAFQATGNTDYAELAREIFTYVLRDMTSPEGGFYSAEDADSEGVEGKFYVWHRAEILNALGEEDGKLFSTVFGITEDGNFHDEATRSKTGANIVHLQQSISGMSEVLKQKPEELLSRMEDARQKLFAVREKRVHPHKDDKILTAWNGLMIAALARGGRALQDTRYTRAARAAADFALTHLRDSRGRLLRSHRPGAPPIPGFLDDYSCFVWGLIELYEATFDVRYLREAVALNKDMLRLFWDEKNGGLYISGSDSEPLIARLKEIYDGATPSGNSAAAMNLVRLSRITGDADLSKKADRLMNAFADEVSLHPMGYTHLLCALDFALGPSMEIVIAGRPGAADTETLIRTVHSRFLPRAVVLFHPDPAPDDAGQAAKEIEALIPWIRPQKSAAGKGTVYVCENFTCALPTTDAKKLAELLNR